MDDYQLKAYKEAVDRQMWLVKKAWRYEDWILVLTNGGQYMKLPADSKLGRPFALVMEGKLPNAKAVLNGTLS